MSYLVSVVVYTVPGDVGARATTAFLARHAIPHRLVDTCRDAAARDWLVRLGFLVAPVLVASTGRAWCGHRPDLLAELVSEADRLAA